MKIGFEFEFLHQLYDDEIIDDLGKKYQIVVDPSVRYDEKCLKRDGWNRWEIITPPESPNKAFKTLRTVQSYLINTDARTNTSCGFHVNVSETNMNKFDPTTLISVTDEALIGNTFNRADNPYCLSWTFYFDKLWKKINRSEKFDKNEKMIDNATVLINSSAYGDWINDEYKYAQRVSKEITDKYVSINVSKLHYNYVEFRMIGGTNYHCKMLEPFVHHFTEGVTYAAKGKNKSVIEGYFNQYGEC
jgi:hypothetical protein